MIMHIYIPQRKEKKKKKKNRKKKGSSISSKDLHEKNYVCYGTQCKFGYSSIRKT